MANRFYREKAPELALDASAALLELRDHFNEWDQLTLCSVSYRDGDQTYYADEGIIVASDHTPTLEAAAAEIDRLRAALAALVRLDDIFMGGPANHERAYHSFVRGRDEWLAARTALSTRDQGSPDRG